MLYGSKPMIGLPASAHGVEVIKGHHPGAYPRLLPGLDPGTQAHKGIPRQFNVGRNQLGLYSILCNPNEGAQQGGLTRGSSSNYEQMPIHVRIVCEHTVPLALWFIEQPEGVSRQHGLAGADRQ
jgi:hypothetical protein